MPIKKLLNDSIEECNQNINKENLVNRVMKTCSELKITIITNVTSNITQIPPWFNIYQNTETNFMQNLTKDTSEEIIRIQFNMMDKTIYKDHKKIFTDGSKTEEANSTSAAIFIKDKNITTMWKLPKETQVIEAELFAIKEALTHSYITNNKIKNSVIYTDSKSVHSIQNTNPKKYKNIIFEIHSIILSLMENKHKIMIQWIPAHKNIKGNEIADLAAKTAHNINETFNITKDISNVIKEIKNKSLKNWEEYLTNALNTKNYYLKNTSPQPWTRSKNRKLDTCITRIKTKHTRLKHHLHRIKIETDPFCRWCLNQEETVEHIFLHCPRFNSNRVVLLEALKKIKISNPNVKQLITGEDLPEDQKYYILRHTKIFLLKTKIIDII
ncbi:uncharacterized protein LOC134777703 [Penaeus indicus]|uniref:uncharacterized protein LOC134777703 n=1 Tax=Penaeus indicus TaxID=29960 RepID=UPI00300D0A87